MDLLKSFVRADEIRRLRTFRVDGIEHHPDIGIRYTDVTFALSSHDAGGITQRDLDLASAIEQAAGFDKPAK